MTRVAPSRKKPKRQKRKKKTAQRQGPEGKKVPGDEPSTRKGISGCLPKKKSFGRKGGTIRGGANEHLRCRKKGDCPPRKTSTQHGQSKIRKRGKKTDAGRIKKTGLMVGRYQKTRRGGPPRKEKVTAHMRVAVGSLGKFPYKGLKKLRGRCIRKVGELVMNDLSHGWDGFALKKIQAKKIR